MRDQQPTDFHSTADQVSTLRALASLAEQYPMLPALRWHFDDQHPDHVTGTIPAGLHAAAICATYRALFGGQTSLVTVQGPDGRHHHAASWMGAWAGVHLYLTGTDAAALPAVAA